MVSLVQRKLYWLRRQFDDLVETLSQLHDQDMQHVTALSIPPSVLAQAQAVASAAADRAKPRNLPNAEQVLDQRTVPNAPLPRPHLPQLQPEASAAMSQSHPKNSRTEGWVMQSIRSDSDRAGGRVRKRLKANTTAIAPIQALQTNASAGPGASKPAPSMQQGSCCEWEDFDEHDPGHAAADASGSPCMAGANLQGLQSTQPNEVLASQRNFGKATGVVPPAVHKSSATDAEEVVDSFP